LIAIGREVFVAQARGGIPNNGSLTSDASNKYIDRVSSEMTTALTPKRNGKRMMLEIEGLENTATIGTLVGLLLPAVQSAREAARRAQSSSNLKQLALAMHNYHDAFQSFPATAILERGTGKPLLSWRVAILPFIEESALYNEFHLDEPWDSEHNKTLIARMPATFKREGKIVPPGHTVYVAPVNEETLLRKDEMARLADVTDGTSNTIMLVEAGEEAAVIWSKPDDLDVDFENPLNKLSSAATAGIFQACFGDGSVRAISTSVDVNLLRALFTRAGGEVTNGF
jgi:Protein of unknown function (DUF1559)